jgi:inorganic pyrophosphatase
MCQQSQDPAAAGSCALLRRSPRSRTLSLVSPSTPRPSSDGDRTVPLEVDVVIEIPKGSFIKRGSTGHVDFLSPFPCPFNYGSVPTYVGLEGDLLDALVLGPRLRGGTRLHIKAWGAVTLMDRGMCDDKLVCSAHPLSDAEKANVLRFFGFYAKCKGLLNLLRRQPGRNACDGWLEAAQALARARPRDEGWRGPPVPF